MQQSPKINSIFVLYTKNFNQVLVGDYLYNGQSQTMALPRFITPDKSELLEDAKKFVVSQLGISLECITSIHYYFHPQDRQRRIFTAQLTSNELPVIKDSSEIKFSFEEIGRAVDLFDMDDQSFDQEAIKRTLPLFHLEFSDKHGDGALALLVDWSHSGHPNRIDLVTSYDIGDIGLDFAEALGALSTKGYATITFDPEGPISTMILLRFKDNVHMIIYTDTPHEGRRYDEDSKAVVEIDRYIPYGLFMAESMRALRQYAKELTTSQYGNEHGKKISEALAKVRP